MKVFSCINFKGHYPVGVAAIVVASDKNFAAKRLTIELTQRGLSQTITEDQLVEIDIQLPNVVILNDGNY